MIQLELSGITLPLRKREEKTEIFDPVRKKWLILTPEEHVRQYVLHYLMERLGYPAPLIAVEKNIRYGKSYKRFDIVVYNRSHCPWMLIECKEPGVAVNGETLFQLLTYHSSLSCKYWLLTNGHQSFCADASDIRKIRWMDSLPAYDL